MYAWIFVMGQRRYYIRFNTPPPPSCHHVAQVDLNTTKRIMESEWGQQVGETSAGRPGLGSPCLGIDENKSYSKPLVGVERESSPSLGVLQRIGSTVLPASLTGRLYSCNCAEIPRMNHHNLLQSFCLPIIEIHECTDRPAIPPDS